MNRDANISHHMYKFMSFSIYMFLLNLGTVAVFVSVQRNYSILWFIFASLSAWHCKITLTVLIVHTVTRSACLIVEHSKILLHISSKCLHMRVMHLIGALHIIIQIQILNMLIALR